MVYATTLSEYKRAMYWWLNIEYFGPNIQYIYGFDKILDDIISTVLPVPNYQDEPSTIRDLCCERKLFMTSMEEIHSCGFPLDLYLVQREKKKYPIKNAEIRLLQASS